VNDGSVLLELQDVTKRYDAAAGGAVGVRPARAAPGDNTAAVLRGISLSVGAGESLAVVGPSGSGKTTLLNIIGSLDSPTTGRVLLEGRDLAGLDEGALAQVRACRIGFVFQLHHLLDQCTVLENVLVPTLARGALREGAESRARQLLERVGLAGRMNYRPARISGGERQRAAVVRALINRPRLLLADEPTGSLDRAAAEDLADLLVQLNKEEGVALIVVTHSPHLAGRMRRVDLLRDGLLQPATRPPVQSPMSLGDSPK
jgi:lipoprotein-releasing system ATP-binding protein